MAAEEEGHSEQMTTRKQTLQLLQRNEKKNTRKREYGPPTTIRLHFFFYYHYNNECDAHIHLSVSFSLFISVSIIRLPLLCGVAIHSMNKTVPACRWAKTFTVY